MLGALTGGQIQGGYDQLCNCIIRPGSDLGPNRFRASGIDYTRTDFELRNPRGLKMQVSHYEPAQGYRPKPKLPCVIYLHGNCGSRLDGLDALELLLPYNITIVTLDFTGSGISEGDYVSLGYYEREDLRVVVDHLRASGSTSRIGLWGRSMGAATAVLYAHTDPSIAGMVLDSGFASLSLLARELAEQSEFKVPKMVVSIAMKMIRKSIKSRAGFDINKLEPIQYVDSCFVPALFAHGNNDSFILPHHCKELHEKYSGDKNVVFFDGDHNTRRPEFFFDSVSIFFHNTLLVEEDKDLVNHVIRQTTKAMPAKALIGPSFEDLENDLLQQALLLSMQEVQASPEAVSLAARTSEAQKRLSSDGMANNKVEAKSSISSGGGGGDSAALERRPSVGASEGSSLRDKGRASMSVPASSQDQGGSSSLLKDLERKENNRRGSLFSIVDVTKDREKDKDKEARRASAAPHLEAHDRSNSVAFRSPGKSGSKSPTDPYRGASPHREKEPSTKESKEKDTRDKGDKASNGSSSPARRASWGGFLRAAISPGRTRGSVDEIPAQTSPTSPTSPPSSESKETRESKRHTLKEEKKKARTLGTLQP